MTISLSQGFISSVRENSGLIDLIRTSSIMDQSNHNALTRRHAATIRHVCHLKLRLHPSPRQSPPLAAGEEFLRWIFMNVGMWAPGGELSSFHWWLVRCVSPENILESECEDSGRGLDWCEWQCSVFRLWLLGVRKATSRIPQEVLLSGVGEGQLVLFWVQAELLYRRPVGHIQPAGACLAARMLNAWLWIRAER